MGVRRTRGGPRRAALEAASSPVAVGELLRDRDRLVTRREAAQLLGVSLDTVDRRHASTDRRTSDALGRDRASRRRARGATSRTVARSRAPSCAGRRSHRSDRVSTASRKVPQRDRGDPKFRESRYCPRWGQMVAGNDSQGPQQQRGRRVKSRPDQHRLASSRSHGSRAAHQCAPTSAHLGGRALVRIIAYAGAQRDT